MYLSVIKRVTYTNIINLCTVLLNFKLSLLVDFFITLKSYTTVVSRS